MLTEWLGCQRFDVVPRSVFEAIQTGEKVVPVVGVALPLDGRAISGGASCFLPIGDLQTGLPVHLNACFHVHKNRRDIWLPGASLGFVSTQGSEGSVSNSHVKWAQWNDTLLRHTQPLLWLEALKDAQLSSAAVLARLAEQHAGLEVDIVGDEDLPAAAPFRPRREEF